MDVFDRKKKSARRLWRAAVFRSNEENMTKDREKEVWINYCLIVFRPYAVWKAVSIYNFDKYVLFVMLLVEMKGMKVKEVINNK